MKNKGLLVLAGLILVVFIAIGTYNWYTFFSRASENYGNSSPNGESETVVLKDTENVYDVDAVKIGEEDISKVTPYVFEIENAHNKKHNYTLLIEDIPLNLVDDGCTEETLLKRQQLEYQLKLNDKVIKQDYLSNITNNILDERTIDSNTINKYELRVFIHQEAEEWTGKHYHYKVTLNNN